MQNSDLSSSFKKITAVIKKTHYFIFTGILIGIIALTALTVSNLLNAPSDAEFAAKLNASKTVEDFGKDPVIPRVTKLDFSTQNTDVSLTPGVRINPFMECLDIKLNFTYQPMKCYEKIIDEKGKAIPRLIYIECYDPGHHIVYDPSQCYDQAGNKIRI